MSHAEYFLKRGVNRSQSDSSLESRLNYQSFAKMSWLKS